MFAVIETGAKQYLVQVGQSLQIEKIEAEKGSKVDFDKVLLIASADGATLKVGAPYLSGAKVSAVVTDQKRDKKIRVVKFHRKVRYKRTHGHRQHQTVIKIEAIA